MFGASSTESPSPSTAVTFTTSTSNDAGTKATDLTVASRTTLVVSRNYPALIGSIGEGSIVFFVWLILCSCLLAAAASVFEPSKGAATEFGTIVGGWDASWLRTIAQHGYSWNAHAPVGTYQNPAFMPLYPLLERALYDLSGWSWTVAAVTLSLLFEYLFVVAVAYGLRLAGATTAEGSGNLLGRSRALRMLVLIIAYPASLFALQGYASSLVLMLEAFAVVAVVRRRPTLAYVWAGIACAADPIALAFPIGYALYRWRESRLLAFPFHPKEIGRQLLGASGMLADIAYFGIVFTDPIARFQAGQAWFPPGTHRQLLLNLLTFRAVRNGLSSYFQSPNMRSYSYFLDALMMIALILCLAVVWKKFGTSWHVLVPGIGAVALLLQSAEYGYTYSVTRLSYPLWLALAFAPGVRRWIGRRAYAFVVILLLELTATAIWGCLLVQGKWLN